MGRQIQIHATPNDIKLLIESVSKDYPKLYRLDHQANIIDLPYDQLDKDYQYHITTEETYLYVKHKIEEYEKMYPEEVEEKKRLCPKTHNIYLLDYLFQCVELSPNIIINEDHSISGTVCENTGRIYVSSDRIKAIDELYACFVKHTKKLSVKYKQKDQKAGYVYYTFPEADSIIKEYLLNRERGVDLGYNIITPDNFPDHYILG